jgi:hypothetical protein
LFKNETSINDALSREIRAANETRGLWYFMLLKSAARYGLDLETYAHGAVRKVGQYYRKRNPDTESIPEFIGAFLSEHVTKQFHAELASLTDEEAIVHFHYCPMAGMWQKLSNDGKLIEKICDCAMDVDRGLFDLYEHIGFELVHSIVSGHDVCKLRFYKK